MAEDATYSIWQDPTTYDYLRHGPPYLKKASGPLNWALMAVEQTQASAETTPNSAEWLTSLEQARVFLFLGALLSKDRYQFDELAVLLAYLRAQADLYQAAHWRSKGPTFYADHLLFERLYNDVLKDIDGLAERLMGRSTGGARLLDPNRQAEQVKWILQEISKGDLNDLEQAVNSELFFQQLTNVIAQYVEVGRGTDNLLADLQDRHEANAYLLKQRMETAYDYSR